MDAQQTIEDGLLNGMIIDMLALRYRRAYDAGNGDQVKEDILRSYDADTWKQVQAAVAKQLKPVRG